MLKNIAVPMFNDNYLWLLISPQKTVIAVDVGDYALLATYLQAHNLQLTTVFITHHHHDHITGLAELHKHFPDVTIYAAKNINYATRILTGGEILNIENFGRFLVLDVKGHTAIHLAFYHLQQQLLYCGDSLFSGGCGRIFPDGNAEHLFDSLQKIALLPNNTQVCAAHEYTLDNLKFAQHIEPNNLKLQHYQNICQLRRQQGQATLPCLLATEKEINPFLRCHLLKERMQTLTHQTCLTNKSTFCTLRAYKNNWQPN